VCQCTGATRGQLGAALASGCNSVAALAARTGASTVCGSCKPLLAELTGGAAEPVQGARWLWVTAAVAGIAALLFALSPAIPYGDSIAAGPSIDLIWRDSFYKQVSGYTALGLSLVALVMSLRKRVRAFKAGNFATWRIVHVVIGASALIALLGHTGARLGANLNLALMTSFLALIVLGSASAATLAFEHRSGAAVARRRWVWAHIAFTWPLPVLLGWHVVKSYYF
jgi:nitrite reductase (NADH) large subunit